MRLLRRSAGEIVFLILAGKSAGAKQVLTFLLRRAGEGEGGGGTVVADKGHEARQSAIACARVRERGREEHVFVAATAAWESRNVMRLTDIKLKYPFWEFAASRVADLPVMFSPALSSFFFSLPFLPPCLPPVPSLSGPGCYRGRGKNRIFHRDVVERAGPLVSWRI